MSQKESFDLTTAVDCLSETSSIEVRIIAAK